MTLSEYERRLKSVNPDLRIKRYGTSKAAIHKGRKFVCRIGQGSIEPYNAFRTQKDRHDQYKTPMNPFGAYVLKIMTKRGRAEAARVLYTQGHIKFNQIAIVS